MFSGLHDPSPNIADIDTIREPSDVLAPRIVKVDRSKAIITVFIIIN